MAQVPPITTSIVGQLTADQRSLSVRVTEFWRNVQAGRPDECWPWTGYADEDGYGLFYLAGRMRPAHELALTFTTGEERIDGLETCHGCNNPICCNPQHLRFDTRQGNVDDAVRSGRNYRPPRKISDADVETARRRHEAGATGKALADEYVVSDGLMSQILHGSKRADAPGPICNTRHAGKARA